MTIAHDLRVITTYQIIAAGVIVDRRRRIASEGEFREILQWELLGLVGFGASKMPYDNTRHRHLLTTRMQPSGTERI
jgi:hypothetical protein